ncbi:hypothetical protein EDD36DRAFT_292882 [Exophiala viscosa]|uniref:Secreted protein n=1 Tax=Exophiala viscosa TaxID=2486360 RepID=A0AAN6IBB7_9EURO|nr:hypothetical protein EDD36DRAFT_292882 [Exophiala viscosa]
MCPMLAARVILLIALHRYAARPPLLATGDMGDSSTSNFVGHKSLLVKHHSTTGRPCVTLSSIIHESFWSFPGDFSARGCRILVEQAKCRPKMRDIDVKKGCASVSRTADRSAAIRMTISPWPIILGTGYLYLVKNPSQSTRVLEG